MEGVDEGDAKGLMGGQTNKESEASGCHGFHGIYMPNNTPLRR